MYDDEYATCAKTYATLRVHPGDLDPLTVTERLAIEPTRWQRRGEPVHRPGWPTKIAPISGWFLSSQGRVESRDSRRHVDWLVDQIWPRALAITSLREAGCRMDISCYWLSQSGHGGPTVSPTQMGKLGELGIELWFDFYGSYEDGTC